MDWIYQQNYKNKTHKLLQNHERLITRHEYITTLFLENNNVCVI